MDTPSRPGSCSIKPEYVNEKHKRRIAECLPDNVKAEVSHKEKENRGKEGKLKWKGQHQKRKRDDNRPQNADLLCPYICKGQSCQFDGTCNYCHDVDSFKKSKPLDIGSKCVFQSAYGTCPYGSSCRLESGHTAQSSDQTELSETRNERNFLPHDAMIRLRKKKYDFELSDFVTNSLRGGRPRAEIPRLTEIDENRRIIDFKNKLYLAPLTTVGNLPFRRVCKELGVDVTCGEMAISTELLQAKRSEWALLKRHSSEDLFGVQLCGYYPDTMTRATQMIDEMCDVDFIDINAGCPIDLVFKKGGGSALLNRMNVLEEIIRGMSSVSRAPITIKLRTGVDDKYNVAHKIVPNLRDWGASLVTLHGRSRQQRFTKFADWDYINQCSAQSSVPLFGNGDILSYEDLDERLKASDSSSLEGCMIARGALIKPWIFTELKERRHWDISSAERLAILQKFVNYGLEHWGSDQRGVDSVRRFLLEWLSFTYRYVPVGILERVPQKINERPPAYLGRDDLETLMASPNCADWIKISEMLLGPVKDGFQFIPKHKANSYS